MNEHPEGTPIQRIRILGISGSLRAASTNTALLRAAALIAPPDVEFVVWEKLHELPHFNPDLEGDLPIEVRRFREQVRASSGIMFSTPEYAHGLPGALKNGLDWLVGGTEYIGKPVTLLNASHRGTFAQDSLIEIVRDDVRQCDSRCCSGSSALRKRN